MRVLTKLRAYKCGWSDRKRCNALTNAFNLVRIDSTALCDSNPLPHVTPRHPDPGSDYTRYVVHIRTCACKRMRPQSNAAGRLHILDSIIWASVCKSAKSDACVNDRPNAAVTKSAFAPPRYHVSIHLAKTSHSLNSNNEYSIISTPK